MAFDATGVYTLPSNSFAAPVAGAVIDPTTATTTFADWATAFNNCITKNGLSLATPQFDSTNQTLTNIPGLSASLAAGKIYSFDAVLFTTSDVGGGVKAAIGGTAGVTSIIYEGMTINAGTITQSRTTTLGNAVGAVTAVTVATIYIKGLIVVSTAGTLTVQFARNAAVATSSVLVNSHFRVIAHT